MRIGTNITALRGHNYLNKVNEMKAKSMEKLSSGKRINSASDDAAGLAISEKMNAQIRGLKQSIRNTQDGQSMVLTAESVLGEVTDILQRMRELATQSANDTYSTTERAKVATEVGELSEELDRIAEEFEKEENRGEAERPIDRKVAKRTPIDYNLAAKTVKNYEEQNLLVAEENTLDKLERKLGI